MRWRASLPRWMGRCAPRATPSSPASLLLQPGMPSLLDSRGSTLTDLDRGALRPRFSSFARAVSTLAGKPVAFGAAVGAVALWGMTGPLFGFSDTWQLVINTATTIVTFLMVFVIQNTQNRDTAAM